MALNEIVLPDGTTRRLGNNIPTKGLSQSWTVFGDTPTTKLIPRSEWWEIDLSRYLPPVYDQDGIGQCNASATVTAIEAARATAGLEYVPLSAGDLYSQINGGRDAGSLLEDGLVAAMKNGIATAATVPYVWNGKIDKSEKAKAERASNKVTEAYICPTFDHMGSAMLQGFFIIQGILWYNNFNVDSDGWLPMSGNGSPGGHALCGYGLRYRRGVWGNRTRNSWTKQWGQNGNCVMPESLFNGPVGGWWAVRQTTLIPDQEPFPQPKNP